MLKLAITVIAIALPDCINPTLIGGELFVATGPQPKRRTLEFTLAAWTVTFLFGLALALGLGDLILSFVPKPGPVVKYALVTAAGLVLVLGGAGVWLRRRSLVSSEPANDPDRSRGSAVLIGAGVAGLELATAFPYFAAIAAIVGSGVDPARQVTLLVLFNLCFVLPLVVIAGTLWLARDQADELLMGARRILQRRWPLLLAGLALLAGTFVILLGITGLASHGHGRLSHLVRRLGRVLHP